MRKPAILITRPSEEQEATGVAFAAAGFEPIFARLLAIEAAHWEPPAICPEALLFTSARAPQFVAEIAPELRAVPAYVVGGHTAEAARRAGFNIVAAGDSDGTAIVAEAWRNGCRNLLHLGGSSRAKIVPPFDMKVQHVAVYHANPVWDLPADVLERLRFDSFIAVSLFSPRTARIFSALTDAANIVRPRIGLIVLSDAVAASAGQGWRQIKVAEQFTLEAMVAAASTMWHEIVHG